MGYYDENGVWQEDDELPTNQPITGLAGLGNNVQMGTYRGNQVTSARDPGFQERMAGLAGLQERLLGDQRNRATETEARGLQALNMANMLATAGGVQKNALPDATPYLNQFARTQTSLDAADTRESNLAESQEQRIAKFIGEAFEDEANREEQDFTRTWNQGQFDYRKSQDAQDNRRADAQLALAQRASDRQRYDRIEGVLTPDGRPVFYDKDSGGSPRVVDSRGNEVSDLRKLTGGAGGANFQRFEGGDGEAYAFDPRTGQATRIGGVGGKNGSAQSNEAKVDTIDQTIATVDGLMNHPGMAAAVGMPSIALWNSPRIPGSAGADFNAQVETLKSQTFLAQVAQMKGMGALSNAEGARLTAALGSLDTNQSEAQFKKTLGTIRSILETGRQRLQSSGGTGGSNLSRNQDGTYNWRP